MKTMKGKFWLGIAISLVCLYFVFRNIEWLKVLETLQTVNYGWLGLSMVCTLSTIWLRAERWKYLLAPIKQLNFQRLVPATMIGFMANNVLPARAGEFIRAYMIGRKEQISKTASFATIVVERVFDMAMNLGFLMLVLLRVDFSQAHLNAQTGFLSPALIRRVGLVSMLFLVGVVVFLVLLKELPRQTTRVVQFVLKPLPPILTDKALELLHSFRLGLQVLKTGAHLAYLIVWSLAVWLVSVLAGWCILRAFGLLLPFIAAMFLTVLIAFSVALPSSPGYIGPFHAAVLTGVLFFVPTLDKSAVAGIALVYHLTVILPITVMGLYYLWKENLTFADIQHLDETMPPPAEDKPVEVNVKN